MAIRRKTKKSLYLNQSENLFKIKRKYEKSFLKSAFTLWLYQRKYSIMSRAADYLFGEHKQKPTIMLRLLNKSVNKAICKCHLTAEKCEYYKQKIERIGAV